MHCPVCREATEVRRIKGGVFHRCVKCQGRWLTLSVLRQSGQRSLAVSFWDIIKSTPPERKSDKLCGSCERPMLALGAEENGAAACKTCQMIWLRQADVQMPEGRPSVHQLSPEDAERLKNQSCDHVPEKAAERDGPLDSPEPTHWALDAVRV